MCKSYKTKAFFRLDCKACISPATMNTKEDVTWFYSSIPPSGIVKVEYDDHVLLSQNKVLHMYNLKQENSGQYLCKVGQTVMAPYFLEVVNDNELTVQAGVNASFHGVYNQCIMEIITWIYKIIYYIYKCQKKKYILK
jgi:hypothetical protein